MLPRYRCSLRAENRLAYSVYRPSGFGFRGSRAWGKIPTPNRTSGARTSRLFGPLQVSAAPVRGFAGPDGLTRIKFNLMGVGRLRTHIGVTHRRSSK